MLIKASIDLFDLLTCYQPHVLWLMNIMNYFTERDSSNLKILILMKLYMCNIWDTLLSMKNLFQVK